MIGAILFLRSRVELRGDVIIIISHFGEQLPNRKYVLSKLGLRKQHHCRIFWGVLTDQLGQEYGVVPPIDPKAE